MDHETGNWRLWQAGALSFSAGRVHMGWPYAMAPTRRGFLGALSSLDALLSCCGDHLGSFGDKKGIGRVEPRKRGM